MDPFGLTKLVLEERDGDDDKILQRGQHCHHHHYFQEKGREDRDGFPLLLSRYPRPMYCLKMSKFCKSKIQLKPSMQCGEAQYKLYFKYLGLEQLYINSGFNFVTHFFPLAISDCNSAKHRMKCTALIIFAYFCIDNT